MTWLPRYLGQLYHLDLIQIGFYSMAPWLFSALMMLGAGMFTDFLFKKQTACAAHDLTQLSFLSHLQHCVLFQLS
ncbi:MAG: hypothetical protein ACRCXC_01250 [Legionella sp.]